jgi:Cu2+-exporting ATPase
MHDGARRLDKALERSGVGLEETVRRTAIDLDDRYQRFMVTRFDPLFGQTRTAQLEEMGSLQISPNEVTLNRRIAFASGLLLATLVGQAIFPASLLVTVPLSFTLVLPVFDMARRSVQQQRRVTYHVISAINVTAIWLGGLYVPAIGATVFYYMGEKLLMITEDRSHKGLISVFSKQPRVVWVLRDGVEMERPFEEVAAGDVVVVFAGGFMPVDGTVVEGLASIDQQMLTGEAQPAEKSPGDKVYASTVVLAGKVHVRVDKAGTETVAAKIGEILNKTASYQLALQSRGSKMAHDAALPTLALAALALPLGPGSALGMLNSSFGVSVRIGAPITMLNLFNIASYNAILLKDGRSLELLGEVDTVLFDKTGTLTLSQPNVAKVHSAGAFDEEQLLTFAAAAEHRQTHPIALAILAKAAAQGLAVPDIDDARYEVGYGITVLVGERKIQVGSDRFMRLSEVALPPQIEAALEACNAEGNSLVMVAVDGVLAGAIELQPTIRPEAEAVVSALRKRGLKMVIISGDQEGPTRRLAEKLGMDRYFANVLPEGKASLVEQLQTEGRSVCFVGDGINDSIALKKANVSVSLRGATTVATDAAQVILMQESLQQLPFLFRLADDMDRALRWGYAAGMIPGVINVAGVFLLGWGYYQALGLTMVSLAASTGIAMYPIYKHRKELARVDAAKGVELGVSALPPSPAHVPALLPAIEAA